MKFVHPEISRVFNTEDTLVNTLVIENQSFMCRLLNDLHNQIDGLNGQCVISENDVPVSCAKCAELLDTFVPFDINKKPLLTKISAALERKAASSEYWEQTGRILTDFSNYLDELAFDFPCDIIFPKIGIGSLIKGAGPELRDDYGSIGEKVIDYMELVRTFDRDKLFFTLNMRSFVTDDETEQFMKTAVSHGYHVIMIESSDRPRLQTENRLIIDIDLCEIDCNGSAPML